MKTSRLKIAKMFSLILALCLALVSFTVQASAQSLNVDSQADVTLLPGDLTLLEVPSITFDVFVSNSHTVSHNAVGKVSGKIAIEDVRYTGRSWTLKVSLGELLPTDQPSKGTMPLVELNIEAPSIRSTMSTTDKATGYPVTLISGSKEYKTIAVSTPTNGNLNAWEGTVPGADIKIPVKNYSMKDGNEYQAAIHWSIEDTP